MKFTILILSFIPFLTIAQEAEYHLDCDYPIVKLTDSTFKIQVANYDSIDFGESCFSSWVNTAKGKPNGKLFVYDENGNKRRMAIYKDGVRTGTHLIWYSTGELKDKTTWETDNYFNSISYFKSGKIQFISENGNRENAIYKSYYENGQIRSLNEFSGVGDIEWYENGQKKLELNKIKNTYKEWYPNGKLKLKGNLLKGWTRIGKWTYYNEKGRRTKKLIYINDNKNISWFGDEAGFAEEIKY